MRPRRVPDPAPRRAISVATEVRARIAEGQLREGDRLPSLADLATEFGISRPTLREALRILEMEFLLDLRGGDRAGATIRTPSTQVAAQLASIVLEARQTTLADFYRALQLVEPAMIELVAARIGKRTLRRLEELDAELGASVEDTGRFVRRLGHHVGRGASPPSQNPALTVTAEILRWVRVGVRPAITVDAKALPGVTKSNRKAHALVSELVAGHGHRRHRASSRHLGSPPGHQHAVPRGVERWRSGWWHRSPGLIPSASAAPADGLGRALQSR